jgi:predicted nucleic acid-binding protein
MQTIFADSYYFLALGNRHDPAHGKSLAFTQTFTGRLVTTGFVLTELVDGCAANASRRVAVVQAIRELRSNPDATIVSCSEQLFQQGLVLFEQRPDKEWSLTDCISFVVMTKDGITDALTGDKHFEQAGFTALLK